jgi:hypothetical protein
MLLIVDQVSGYKADYLSRWIGTDFNASAKYIYNCFPMIHVICHDVIYAIAFNSFFLYIYVYIYIYIFIFIFISIFIFHYSHTCICTLYIAYNALMSDVKFYCMDTHRVIIYDFYLYGIYFCMLRIFP